MKFLGFLIIIGVVIFAVFQVIGIVKDIKERRKANKGVIRDKSAKVDDNNIKDSDK